MTLIRMSPKSKPMRYTGMLFCRPRARLALDLASLSPIQDGTAYERYAQFKREIGITPSWLLTAMYNGAYPRSTLAVITSGSGFPLMICNALPAIA